jgi:hypothetical protein
MNFYTSNVTSVLPLDYQYQNQEANKEFKHISVTYFSLIFVLKVLIKFLNTIKTIFMQKILKLILEF